MMDFRKILLAVAPHGKPEILDGFAAALPKVIAYADLTTNLRLAMFLAQCAEESAGFATTTEYASGAAYNGRKDLGNVQPGDGPRFKGRGLFQLTGRANYRAAGAALGLPLETNPTRAAGFPEAALTAAWFWKSRDLNLPADKGSVSAVTMRVNGGENGLSRREAYYKKALAATADLKGALTTAAAEEAKKASTKAKGAAGSIIAAGGAGTAHMTTSGHWALILGAVALGGLAVWLFLSIRKHQDAAAALIAAAKGA